MTFDVFLVKDVNLSYYHCKPLKCLARDTIIRNNLR